MPVRLSTSSVLVWPNAEAVLGAARDWAHEIAARDERVHRIGYFGSYARGQAGVGSDLDVVAVVGHSDLSFARRATMWETTGLPVPIDLLVYTREEWRALVADDRGWGRTLREETRWWIDR